MSNLLAMRITILCNRDLASCVALNRLLPALVGHELSVFTSAQVGVRTSVDAKPIALQQLQFYEQQLFDSILFPLLAVSHAGRQPQWRSFTGLSHLLEQPVQELNAINQPDGLAMIAAQKPDLMLSIRYGSILKDSVLTIPKIGVLNLHSGLLPTYKGVMATFRALLNGDGEIGTTLHWIDDSSIDTGRIVATATLPVATDKSYLAHVLALYEGGCALLIDAVNRLAQGEELASHPQGESGNYFSFPVEEELDAFQRAGWQLVIPREIEAIARRFMG